MAGDGFLDGRITAPSAAQSRGTTPSTTRGQECGSTWVRARRFTTLSCTPFIVLCSRSSENPAARRSPFSQTPRQPYRDYIRRSRPRTAIRSRNRTTGTRPMGATKSLGISNAQLVLWVHFPNDEVGIVGLFRKRLHQSRKENALFLHHQRDLLLLPDVYSHGGANCFG